MPKTKVPVTPVQRSIRMYETRIANGKKKIASMRRETEEEVERLQKSLDRQKVLLDALKRGELTQ